jgi:hypothetical protein
VPGPYDPRVSSEPQPPPEVRLGKLVESGVAPSMFGLVEHGVPNPARVRGRAALARVARRHVRVTGDRALARKLLRLLAL